MMKKEIYSDYINELFLYHNAVFERPQSQFMRIISLIIWRFLAFPVFFLIVILLSSFLLVLPRLYLHERKSLSTVCVARSFATESKLVFLEEAGVVFFYEKIFNLTENKNIYNLPFYFRLKAFFDSIYTFFKDVLLLSNEASSYLTLSKSIIALISYFSRLPHKVVFTSYFKQFVFFYTPNVLVTGNKEDRFALVEQNVCKRYGLKLICYPHGLEYGMKLPRGVVGNVFYCYSDSTRIHYEKIYKDSGQKFIFDSKIVESMLRRTSTATQLNNRLIVFFPESRGEDVNYRIIESIMHENIDLYLKLHPSDSIDGYVKLGFSEDKILKDFDVAISGNIVLARKSTVLLEALYSGSQACALLFDKSDEQAFNEIFPSLWDGRIKQFKNIKQLTFWLGSEDSIAKLIE